MATKFSSSILSYIPFNFLKFCPQCNMKTTKRLDLIIFKSKNNNPAWSPFWTIFKFCFEARSEVHPLKISYRSKQWIRRGITWHAEEQSCAVLRLLSFPNKCHLYAKSVGGKKKKIVQGLKVKKKDCCPLWCSVVTIWLQMMMTSLWLVRGALSVLLIMDKPT